MTFNLERLQQAKGQLETSIVPNYPLDTSQMNYWLTECTDILPDEIFRRLDWQRYQLDHVSQKFVLASESVVFAHSFNSKPNAEYSKALTDSLLQHVMTVLKELPIVMAELERMPNKAMHPSRGSGVS